MVDAGKFVTHVLDLTFIETAKKVKYILICLRKILILIFLLSLTTSLPPPKPTVPSFCNSVFYLTAAGRHAVVVLVADDKGQQGNGLHSLYQRIVKFTTVKRAPCSWRLIYKVAR